jgi:hypothetical protein
MESEEQFAARIGALLRAELDPIVPSAELIDRLMTRNGKLNRRVRWGFLIAPGTLVAVSGVAVAIAIAVIAVVGLGRGGQSNVPASSRVPASVQALVRQLAILRRPQTPADRTLRSALPTGVRRSLVPGLTRLALGFDGKRIYVVVRLLRISVGPPGGVRRAGLARQQTLPQLDLVPAPASGPAALIPQPLPSGLLNDLVSARLRTRPHVGSDRLAPEPVIVRAGFTRVRWTYSRAGGHGTITVRPTVLANVAIARAVPGQGQADEIVWYGAGDQVIARLDLARRRLRAILADRAAITRSYSRPVAPSLLAHFSVFDRPQSPVPGLHTVPQLPPGIAAQFARQRGGLNLRYTRFVPLPGTEPPVQGFPHGIWIVPGHSVLCFQDTQLAGGCSIHLGNGPGSPLEGGDVTTSGGGRDTWVEGLVPDGNPTVTLILADGRSLRVPVTDNAYAVALHQTVRTLIARDAAGQRVRFSL